MKKIKTHGYDPLYCYSINELKQMYNNEGLTDKEALQRAKKTKKTIDKINDKEAWLWRSTRKYEKRVRDIENLGE